LRILAFLNLYLIVSRDKGDVLASWTAGSGQQNSFGWL